MILTPTGFWVILAILCTLAVIVVAAEHLHDKWAEAGRVIDAAPGPDPTRPACDTRTQDAPPCRRPGTVTVTDTAGQHWRVCPGCADEGVVRGWWRIADFDPADVAEAHLEQQIAAYRARVRTAAIEAVFNQDAPMWEKEWKP